MEDDRFQRSVIFISFFVTFVPIWQLISHRNRKIAQDFFRIKAKKKSMKRFGCPSNLYMSISLLPYDMHFIHTKNNNNISLEHSGYLGSNVGDGHKIPKNWLLCAYRDSELQHPCTYNFNNTNVAAQIISLYGKHCFSNASYLPSIVHYF